MNLTKYALIDALIHQEVNLIVKPNHVYQIALIDLLIHHYWLPIDLLNFYRNIKNEHPFTTLLGIY